MISVREFSASLNVAFGTSGVRGLVENLTSDLCYAYTMAFIQSICSQSSTNNEIPPSRRIAVGIDLRPSSPAIAKACIQAIEDAGYQAVYCGSIPTPALAFYAISNFMPSIMITGSHIPFDRNGIKFYRAEGEISKVDEQAILTEEVELPENLLAKIESAKLPDVQTEAILSFQARYLSLFAQVSSGLKGMRIGFYQHSSVARDALTSVLEQLGAEVVPLERTETFVPIDTEAVSAEDKKKGLVWAKEGFDALISTDGDGDRPLIGDEKGHWLRGDIVGILCAEYLQASHVVTPVNSNTALESSPIKETIRTKIGSPYVIAGMELLPKNESTKVVGYEANGGFLLGSDMLWGEQGLTALPTRDSFLPILLLLVEANRKKVKLSQLSQHLPPRFTASDRLKEYPSELSAQLLNNLKASISEQELLIGEIADSNIPRVSQINELDGLRMVLDNDEIVHLRPSGNAPELRCYAEADTSVRAEKIVSAVLSYIKGQK